MQAHRKGNGGFGLFSNTVMQQIMGCSWQNYHGNCLSVLFPIEHRGIGGGMRDNAVTE